MVGGVEEGGGWVVATLPCPVLGVTGIMLAMLSRLGLQPSLILPCSEMLTDFLNLSLIITSFQALRHPLFSQDNFSNQETCH